MNTIRKLVAAAAAMAVTLPAVAGAIATRYVARDLGTLGGATSIATGLDDAGRVIGTADRGGEQPAHAFVTGPDGVGMLDLCPAQALSCGATAISPGGLVVGNYETPLGVTGFTVNRDGSAFATLGPNHGPRSTAPAAINVSNRIVGSENFGGSAGTRAFAASGPDGPLFDLVAITGADGLSYGLAINDSNNGAGCSLTAEGQLHAYIQGGLGRHIQDIGTLGGAQSCAWAMNPSGTVAGWSDTTIPDAAHAFYSRWPYATLVDIGTLGGLASHATGLNDAGHVVGNAENSGVRYRTHAFVYDIETARLVDLNKLVELPRGLVLTQAAAINAHDQIAANGSNGHAFLLTPVSE